MQPHCEGSTHWSPSRTRSSGHRHVSWHVALQPKGDTAEEHVLGQPLKQWSYTVFPGHSNATESEAQVCEFLPVRPVYINWLLGRETIDISQQVLLQCIVVCPTHCRSQPFRIGSKSGSQSFGRMQERKIKQNLHTSSSYGLPIIRRT